MKHFPIFLNVEAASLVVAGGGEAALAKMRLLLKTEAQIVVFAAKPAPTLLQWAADGRLRLIPRALRSGDVDGAALFYAAHENALEDARTAAIARSEGALVNVVDNLEDSQFITPAIVDRDPVTVAIGTEGTAPVLARAIKRDLEAQLSPKLGRLAQIANRFRPLAKLLPLARTRRAFWEDFFFKNGPRIAAISDDAEHDDAVTASLHALLQTHLTSTRMGGHVDFIGAGTSDPEMLTLKARAALDKADVVIHDPQIAPEILELARREAIVISVENFDFRSELTRGDVTSLMVNHGLNGLHVVHLMAGDLSDPARCGTEIAALETAGLDWQIIPGVSVVLTAVAAIAQTGPRAMPKSTFSRQSRSPRNLALPPIPAETRILTNEATL